MCAIIMCFISRRPLNLTVNDVTDDFYYTAIYNLDNGIYKYKLCDSTACMYNT